MGIFHSYVGLPEGNMVLDGFNLKNLLWSWDGHLEHLHLQEALGIRGYNLLDVPCDKQPHNYGKIHRF